MLSTARRAPPTAKDAARHSAPCREAEAGVPAAASLTQGSRARDQRPPVKMTEQRNAATGQVLLNRAPREHTPSAPADLKTAW